MLNRRYNTIILTGFILILLSANVNAAEPEQVHLATTGKNDEMVIQWGTQEDTTALCDSDNIVEYGTDSNNLNLSENGDDDMYLWTTCTHTTILSGLEANTTYYYRVGGSDEWSNIFSFNTLKEETESVRIGAIADHGTSGNAQETTDNMAEVDFDLVIHAGDISYANDVGSGNGFGDQSIWDEYQNLIEKIASKSPHMYAPGNHEEDAEPYGFDAYESRFYTTGTNSFWYSFDFEYIHFVSISSEHEYEPGSSQYVWFENDLEEANENRENVPWIIVFAHRPMYSSNGDGDGHGSEIEFRDAMESLLFDYGVDLAIWGHDHHYERTYPVFDEKVYANNTGGYDDPYYLPKAPIHIVAGTAGRSVYDGLEEPQPEWSAYRELSYGYTQFEVTENGTLHYKFIRNSDGDVSDEFWIIKSLDYYPEQVIDVFEPDTNLTNQTEEKDIVKKIKELNYLSSSASIIIVAITAILSSRYRKTRL